MIYNVYSIRDELTGFMTPVVEHSDAVAMRNFQMACSASKRDTSLMAFRPSDYILYQIGTFDTDSGLISPVVPIVRVCSGDSFEGV